MKAQVDVIELLGSKLLVHLRLAGADDFVVRAIVSEAAGVSEDETDSAAIACNCSTRGRGSG